MTRAPLPPSRANVVFGYFLVSMAVTFSAGSSSLKSIFLFLSGAFILCMQKEFFTANRRKHTTLLKSALVVFIVVIFSQWLWLFAVYPIAEAKIMHIFITFMPHTKLLILLMTFCVLVVAVLFNIKENSKGKIEKTFFSLSLLYLILMAFSLCIFCDPPIDTYGVFQMAGRNLHHGKNPYGISYPNVYYHSDEAAFLNNIHKDPLYQKPTLYHPFDYFPGILPFLWLADFWGDIRFLFLLFHFGFALLLFVLSEGKKEGALWSLLHLLNPVSIYLLIHSLLDPLLTLSLGLSIFCLVRKKNLLLSLIFGYMLCIKQYAVFLILAFWRFLEKKTLLFSLLVSCSILFLAWLWSPADFVRGALIRPLGTPPRDNVISFFALLSQSGMTPLFWRWMPLVCTAPFIILSTRKTHLSSMLYYSGMVYFMLFFFSHMAAINYYYFALAFIPLSQVLPDELNTEKNTP